MKYDVKQTETFSLWLKKLKDRIAKIAILRRIVKLQDGVFGDSKYISDGIYELRINISKGYRVYFTNEENLLLILLIGGNKSTQSKDIEKAKELKNGKKH